MVWEMIATAFALNEMSSFESTTKIEAIEEDTRTHIDKYFMIYLLVVSHLIITIVYFTK